MTTALAGAAKAAEETVTLTAAQIKAGSGSSSYGSCSAIDGGGNTWNAYAIKNQHSNATSSEHFWQIKKYASNTAYYVQVPSLGSKITQLEITVSSTSKASDGGGNSATLYFSASNSTSATGAGVVSGTGASAVTIDCSSLNLNTGYITASAAVRIWGVTVTYTSGGGSTTYTVTYDGNDATSGSVPTDNTSYSSGATVTVLGNTGSLAKAGYTFGGWNTQDDGLGTNYTDGNTFTISANTTLYAKWNPYTITAVSNNDSYGTVSGTTTITATPEEGYRVVAGDGGYDVTSGSATVTNNGDNTFSVTPSSDCTVRINFEAIPSYTVTINTPTGGTLTVKNGESPVTSGDKILDGTVLTITATPGGDYNFRNWQAVDASTHTYTSSNTGNYTVNGNDVTFKANFDSKVYHDAYFLLNGGTQHAKVKTEEGTAIDFPDNPEAVEGRDFVGWVADAIDGTTDEAPEFVTSANMGDEDVTYYACYAYRTPGSTTTKTDVLTLATTGVSGNSYTDFTDKSASNSGHSDAVYKGNCAGSYDAIQLRSTSYSGIITTTSGGKAKKVTVTWESHTPDERTIWVYGKNNAYEAVGNLFESGVSTPGTLIGSIVNGTSTELEITGDYAYIGLRSSSGAMYLDEIDIDWQTGTPDTYSSYCTTVPADARTSVNIESFTATNTTLVIGNTTTTAVTNDQDGWTESYIYTSDDTSVATVSDEGVITAVAKGTANITVTLNIPVSGGSYKKGETFSKSLEITVTKPFHTVTFMANGSQVSSTSVEEDADIDVPSDPSDVGNFSFQGWKASSAIDGTQSSAPSYASISTMGNADITYYAVYAVEKDVTATFDASDITATPATGNTLEWKHTATGILLKLSAGQRYTSGTPYTFSVTSGTSNYFRITAPTGGVITQIVTEISETKYKINSVTAGSLSTSGTTQTVTFTNAVNTVDCKATSSNQIRAVSIDVDATLRENFCTTIPAYSVTVGGAGYTTYVAANNVSFPVGATAYIATATDASTVTLEEVLAVPTGTAVVVKGAAGTYNLDVEASGDCDDVSGNLLQASDGSVNGDGSTIYALGVGKTGANEGKVGFYLVGSGVQVPAGKAYLVVGGGAKEFLTFDFDDEATSIEETLSNSTLKDENIYNLAGQRLQKMQKGINIVNGKKILK